MRAPPCKKGIALPYKMMIVRVVENRTAAARSLPHYAGVHGLPSFLHLRRFCSPSLSALSTALSVSYTCRLSYVTRMLQQYTATQSMRTIETFLKFIRSTHTDFPMDIASLHRRLAVDVYNQKKNVGATACAGSRGQAS